MGTKPVKVSNFVRFNHTKPEDYIETLDKDLNNLFTYLSINPRLYQQSAQPTLSTNEFAFWKDTDNDKFYLLVDIAGDTKTVELT